MITVGMKIPFTMTKRSLLSANYFLWLFKKQTVTLFYFHYYHFSDSDSLEFLHGHMDE